MKDRMKDRDPAEIYASTLVPMVVEQTSRGERAYGHLFTSSSKSGSSL